MSFPLFPSNVLLLLLSFSLVQMNQRLRDSFRVNKNEHELGFIYTKQIYTTIITAPFLALETIQDRSNT